MSGKAVRLQGLREYRRKRCMQEMLSVEWSSCKWSGQAANRLSLSCMNAMVTHAIVTHAGLEILYCLLLGLRDSTLQGYDYDI